VAFFSAYIGDDKMYLLQSGGTENIVNSVGTLSEGQMIISGIFILLAIPTTVLSVYFFVKKLNIRTFGGTVKTVF
jgi:hypothetical protein